MFEFLKKIRPKKPQKVTKEEIRNEKAEKAICRVMEKTGWSYEKSLEAMKTAKLQVGISFTDYNKYNFFSVPAAECEAAYQRILKKKALAKEEREKCIRITGESLGISRDEAIAVIDDAKKRLKISYKDYAQYAFYAIPVSQQDLKYQEILERRRLNKQTRENRRREFEQAVHLVMEETGWDEDFARKMMDISKEVTGADYNDYAKFHFWNLKQEEQLTYFTKGITDVLRKKYNVNKENLSILQSKAKFNSFFSDFIGRKWVSNKEISFEEFTNIFKDREKIIYKPTFASCGVGVRVFVLNDNSLREVFEELRMLPIGLIEDYLVQHKEVGKYSQNAVNTIRVVTITEKQNVNVVYSSFRMGVGDSVIDNLHGGGILSNICLESGKVCTDAIDAKGNIHKKHPTTGEPIKGFAIPFWRETLDLATSAASLLDGIGYVGWDIAITENGPVIVEGNSNPDHHLLQAPYVASRQGMRFIVETYL